MSTILDLHSHSEASEDSRAPLEAYLNWLKLRRAERPVDGIVLTEHRQFNQNADYRALEDKFGVLVLEASRVGLDRRPARSQRHRGDGSGGRARGTDACQRTHVGRGTGGEPHDRQPHDAGRAQGEANAGEVSGPVATPVARTVEAESLARRVPRARDRAVPPQLPQPEADEDERPGDPPRRTEPPSTGSRVRRHAPGDGIGARVQSLPRARGAP